MSGTGDTKLTVQEFLPGFNERWKGTMEKLAEGPTGVGPHSKIKQQYEYSVSTCDNLKASMQYDLHTMSKLGWRLAHANFSSGTTTFIFERKVSS